MTDKNKFSVYTRTGDTEEFIRYDSVDEMMEDFDRSWKNRPTLKKAYHFLYHKTRDLKWWILYRFHPKHRYHLIHTGLKPNYYDTDILMEATIIRLFLDYIEHEKPFEIFDTEDEIHAEAWKRIKFLYEYFKKVNILNTLHERTENSVKRSINRGDFDALHLVARVRRDRYTNYLCEVVKLRGHYWT